MSARENKPITGCTCRLALVRNISQPPPPPAHKPYSHAMPPRHTFVVRVMIAHIVLYIALVVRDRTRARTHTQHNYHYIAQTHTHNLGGGGSRPVAHVHAVRCVR